MFEKKFNKIINNNINKNKFEIYNIHIKKTINNYFLTLTKTINCNVIYHLSAGHCKIFTKKKKKSLETLRQITKKMSEFLLLNRITYINNFIINLTHPYYFKKSIRILKKNKIFIKRVLIMKKKTHNGIRKKKLKRL